MIPAQNKYLATAVQTATPAQLLIMLYDGAIRFCRLGIQGIKQRKFDDVNYNLCKAQEILRELAMTANPNMEISENLVKLYDYFVFRLIEANTKKSCRAGGRSAWILSRIKGNVGSSRQACQRPGSRYYSWIGC